MRLLMVVAFLILAMPMTELGWVEGTNILLDSNLVCKKTRKIRGKIAEICQHDSGLLKEIINGIHLGFRECEYQFKNRHWNCTTLRRSMRKILMKDTRESGFVNAITSAGVTFAVTKACTAGKLVECSCDRSHSKRNGGQMQMVNAATAAGALELQQSVFERGNNTQSRRSHRLNRKHNKAQPDSKRKLLRNLKFPEGEWEWGGCSDNVHFGLRNSRVFLDSKYRKRSDLRTLVRLHNNQAGRLVVRDSMRLECKCHGLSGSCTVKTCWLKTAPFRTIADHLRERYDRSSKVVLRNDGNSFMPENSDIRLPTKFDLVFTEESGDFCVPNLKIGSLGTQDRECNATSFGFDNCDSLCCSRGHKHRIVSEWIYCKCVFKWCCEVTCEKCVEKREINTCL